MKLHERTMMVQQAGNKLARVILEWSEKEGEELTWIEVARILNEQVAMALKYALRVERHPDDPEKKADEA